MCGETSFRLYNIIHRRLTLDSGSGGGGGGGGGDGAQGGGRIAFYHLAIL